MYKVFLDDTESVVLLLFAFRLFCCRIMVYSMDMEIEDG